jgi:hypothetical protein
MAHVIASLTILKLREILIMEVQSEQFHQGEIGAELTVPPGVNRSRVNSSTRGE